MTSNTQSNSVISFCAVLIASTALHHNLVLVTRNLRHYQRIPELQLYSDAVD